MTSQVNSKHSEVTPFGKDLEQWQENGQKYIPSLTEKYMKSV